MSNKVAIGGIGGSGTRAVAELFKEMGFFMGSDLNDSNDNLLYTLLFKRRDILLLPKDELHQRLEFFYKCNEEPYKVSESEKQWLYTLAANDNVQHKKEWLYQRAKKCMNYRGDVHKQWGWKEPNTHLIIDKILEYSPEVKFIYVYRNGLDMAYSSNQNQLIFWGDIFFNENSIKVTPGNSLKYWCLVHKRMEKLQTMYPQNIYLFDLDKCCEDGGKYLKLLFDFMKFSTSYNVEKFTSLFVAPSSTGRYKEHSLENFSEDDLSYVKSICERRERDGK